MNISKGKLRASWVQMSSDFSIQLSGVKGRREVFFTLGGFGDGDGPPSKAPSSIKENG